MAYTAMKCLHTKNMRKFRQCKRFCFLNFFSHDVEACPIDGTSSVMYVSKWSKNSAQIAHFFFCHSTSRLSGAYLQLVQVGEGSKIRRLAEGVYNMVKELQERSR